MFKIHSRRPRIVDVGFEPSFFVFSNNQFSQLLISIDCLTVNQMSGKWSLKTTTSALVAEPMIKLWLKLPQLLILLRHINHRVSNPAFYCRTIDQTNAELSSQTSSIHCELSNSMIGFQSLVEDYFNSWTYDRRFVELWCYIAFTLGFCLWLLNLTKGLSKSISTQFLIKAKVFVC